MSDAPQLPVYAHWNGQEFALDQHPGVGSVVGGAKSRGTEVPGRPSGTPC
jgi:hypothetical protein